MVEGEEAEGHVEAEEAVVLIEVVATVLLIIIPLLKIQKACQGGGVFRTKTEPRR
jgi:hypothetical protein